MGIAESDTPEMAHTRSAWPELVYRLIEHYKWEPQHLCLGQSADKFYQRIRRHEVPLTFLLQILLRLTSPATTSALLKTFEVDNSGISDDHWQLRYPKDAVFTQPDLWLESDRSRIFIEIKIGATIRVEQVQKYLLLHTQQDIEVGQKRPYLLFLTATEFMRCWRPSTIDVTDDIQDFLEKAVASAPLPRRLEKIALLGRAADRYEEVKQHVQYGTASWRSLRQGLEGIATRLKETGENQVEIAIIRDFLHELNLREL